MVLFETYACKMEIANVIFYIIEVANYRESSNIPRKDPLVLYILCTVNRKYNHEDYRNHSRLSLRIIMRTETHSYSKYTTVLQDKFQYGPLIETTKTRPGQ